jgi:hypothetical protein
MHTLDRRDNDGDYTPENCRWVTQKVQTRNRSSNRLITIDDVTKTMTEWCEQHGIRLPAFRQRVIKGMTPEEALTTPLQKRKMRKGS